MASATNSATKTMSEGKQAMRAAARLLADLKRLALER
jgi:hypothetical protein